ncbi:putative ATP synthase subunit f, mitochondrial [Lineus longissimus]|uniref:putative ATP synthase subunit f, mitochondrial n=1 Tax=Lineus longissimus TaxID=88925 RepID=UPI002B4C3710
MNIGHYPKEFNPRIHGVYNPATYYGKPDPLSEVKVGQIGQWLSRRNYGPQAMASAVSRTYWRWMQKYVLVRKASVAPFVQTAMCLSAFYYFFQYRSHSAHRHAKYH